MRCHPDAVGAGQLNDPAEWGDAAHPDNVGLDDVHGFRFDEVTEAVDGVDVLTQGNGNRRVLAQAPVCPEVVGANRFFQPLQSVLPQNIQCTERVGEVPTLVGVDHEQPVRADHLAHCGNALGILPELGLAHFDLHRVVSGSNPPLGLLHELFQGVVQVHSGAVHLHGFLAQAQEPRDGRSRLACFQVPQGKVHARHGDGGQPSPARFMQPLPQLVPHNLRVRLDAPDEGGDVVVQEGLHCLGTDGRCP
ncbi:hypothetical protein PJL18_04021 [Paenarthrobacter nicotinovorans]|nr:hypothetical protein [Paenarthrobacter nicotinovorans]